MTTDLPLVLVTVGNTQKEFETLYDHLESVAQSDAPEFQSLIVARHDMPDVFYAVLRSKADQLPSVHIRRLNDGADQCERVSHASGAFYATRPRKFCII